MATVLSVKNLSVDYERENQWLPAVSNVSFDVQRGEVLGIVGESGCGKTTLARALARLLPDNGRISSGVVDFGGIDLVASTPKDLADVRWTRLSVIFQSALNSLDPVYKIGFQISEAIKKHDGQLSRREMAARARSLLESVGIPGDRVKSYPHELSGGMRQRVSIAMALALSPDLVIADEPTTALDVVTQDNVLHELVALQREKGASLILISHDMGVIAETCDRVAVMYAGEIVELAPVSELFRSPAHPYSMGLKNAMPQLNKIVDAVAIPGFPPPSAEWGEGCRFAPRCPFSVDACSQRPPRVEISESHHALCHRTADREHLRQESSDPATWLRDLPNDLLESEGQRAGEA